MSRNVEELSEMIIGVLCERVGFESYWLDLDDSWKEQIEENIQSAISDWLANPPYMEEDEYTSLDIGW